jgi:hypothetical protein
LEKTEDPIHQRLEKLINELEDGNKSAFARNVGVQSGVIGDLLGKRKNKPGYELLNKIASAYPQVNTSWLLRGIEPMLLSGASEPRAIYQKNDGGINIGTNHGTATQTYTTLADCEKDLKSAHERIALLASQLQDKERIIQLLELQLNK